ncbi:Hvo_1808 family surface protein [Halomicrobium katesii]|uniref:Hvo_1808 family surface protein n=1 Tax=Halomicrobium katesii TaxID=437163 RepID=UPI00036E03D6|nr:Hvo_1808 family surface protein [Halomicrobium katesii]
MRRVAALALLVVLAGCLGAVNDLNPADRDRPADEDPIGWEDGYWYDDSVSVTTEDGLNASERAAALARSKARVERIRDREFDGNVSVEVISRAEYRNQSLGPGGTGPDDPWNDQVWEALLLVGEDSGTSEAMGETYNASVQGYYSPASDNITIVSDSPTPTVDRSTLSHELVHALQDQYDNLESSPETQDRQLARQSVTEGEANYVQWTYEDRCENRWQCLSPPGGDGSGESSGGGAPTDGVFVTIYQPYATGPGLIDQQYGRNRWDGVERLYENPPDSTEQVIHPDRYPDEEPVNVTVPDRSSDEWERFDHEPVADTAGEASIFAMLYTNDAVEPEQWFRYRSDASAGWGGDSIVPYRDGSGGYGYVWTIEWDSPGDAREFEAAYTSILDDKGASRPSETVYRVPDSDAFGDAFRVTRSGSRVRIVNAPTVDDLGDVHERPS